MMPTHDSRQGVTSTAALLNLTLRGILNSAHNDVGFRIDPNLGLIFSKV